MRRFRWVFLLPLLGVPALPLPGRPRRRWRQDCRPGARQRRPGRRCSRPLQGRVGLSADRCRRPVSASLVRDQVRADRRLETRADPSPAPPRMRSPGAHARTSSRQGLRGLCLGRSGAGPEGQHNCANCHGEIYREWTAAAMPAPPTTAASANLYEGSDWHGRRNVGWSLLADHPDGAGVCTSCHAPTVGFGDPAYFDLRKVCGVAARASTAITATRSPDVDQGPSRPDARPLRAEIATAGRGTALLRAARRRGPRR